MSTLSIQNHKIKTKKSSAYRMAEHEKGCVYHIQRVQKIRLQHKKAVKTMIFADCVCIMQ